MSSEVGPDDGKLEVGKDVDQMKIEMLHGKVAMLEEKLIENTRLIQRLDLAFGVYKENNGKDLITQIFEKMNHDPCENVTQEEIRLVFFKLLLQIKFILQWVEEFGIKIDVKIIDKLEKIQTVDRYFDHIPDSKYLMIQWLTGTNNITFVNDLYKRAVMDYSNEVITTPSFLMTAVNQKKSSD